MFDGVDDYAMVFPGFQLLTGWTVEAWVSPVDPANTGGCILSLHTYALRNLLTIASLEGGDLSVVYGPDEQAIPHRAWTSGYRGLFTETTHHISLTHKVVAGLQSGMELYLNGTLHAAWVVDAEVVRARPEPALPVLLGACHTVSRGPLGSREAAASGVGRHRFFAGQLDEVRWWTKTLPYSQVSTMHTWTGPPAAWPPVEFLGGALGLAAVAARANALQAQYSMDIMTARLHDGGNFGNHGWRGTFGGAPDAPSYARSQFDNKLVNGSIYRELRADSRTVLDFMFNVVSFGGTFYNGLLLVDAPAHLALWDPATGNAIAAGSLIAGLEVGVTATTAVAYDRFSFQPCAGPENVAPVATACPGHRVRDVALSVRPSVAPKAGSRAALRLLRRGGFVTLPRLRGPAATVEMWVQLTPPLVEGATLLSLTEVAGADGTPGREVVRIFMSGDAATLEMCVMRQSSPERHSLSSDIAGLSPQHLAISFERAGNHSTEAWSYEVRVHRNGALIFEKVVQEPCASLDSPRLRRPTLGHRYVDDLETARHRDEEPWSQDFLPMSLAEIRVWDHVRSPAVLLASMSVALIGSETGLVAYAPVTLADIAAANGTGAQRLALESPLLGIEVMCASEVDRCPDVSGDVGFALLWSPFDLPPEPVLYQTTRGQDLTIPFSAYDLDDFGDRAEMPRTSEIRYFEITKFPLDECGYIFGEGDKARIPTTSRARPAEVMPQNRLPLRFAPFAGATIAQEAAMNGTCLTEIRYRAYDNQGLRSPHEASVSVRVLRTGVEIRSVNASARGFARRAPVSALPLDSASAGFWWLDSASSPSLDAEAEASLAAGGVLRFDFSAPTNAPAGVGAAGLFDVLNGSWGTSEPNLTWTNQGATLFVELGSDAVGAGALLIPGRSSFRIRPAARLLVAGDPYSEPSDAASPQLGGDFGSPNCGPGYIFDKVSTACYACPAGDFWSAEADTAAPVCLPCLPGTFSTQAASSECMLCEPGRYLPEGSANRTACLLAAPGEFVPFAQETKAERCLRGALAEQPGRSECRVCPHSADCLAVGSLAVALPEHFRLPSGEFGKCRVPSVCLGADVCASGARSPELGCYPCAKGYTRGPGALRDRRTCTACPTRRDAGIASGGALLAAVLLALLLARLNVTAARRPSVLHSFVLKVGLGHLMLMNTLSTFEEWELATAFGPASEALFHTLQIILKWDGMAPFSQLLPVPCVLEWFIESVEVRLWLELLFWVMLPGVFALLCVALGYVVVQAVAMLQCMRCVSEPGASKGEGEESQGPLDSVVPIWLPPDTSSALALQTSRVDEGGGDIQLWGCPGSLPTGWEAVWSVQHDRYYYYNVAEGTSTWLRPVYVPTPSPTYSLGGRAAPEAAGEEQQQVGDLVAQQLEYRIWGIWRWPSARGSWRRHFLDDSVGLVIASLMLTYPPTLRQVAAFLRCDRMDASQAPRLLMAPDIVCDTGPQHALAAVAWLFLLGWGLGAPAGVYAWYTLRKNVLADFGVRLQSGLLFSEYERTYAFWETSLLLQRFAAVAAATLSPSAPQALRVVLILAVGNACAFMHNSNLPFDNQSAELLDDLSTRALQIFCAFSVTLLLGFSRIVDERVCAALVFLALLVHVIFLLTLTKHYLLNLRRSFADSVVALHMKGERAGWLGRRIFKWEMSAQVKQAHVTYEGMKCAICVKPPPENPGKEVQDHEQRFVASGLADCIAHTIAGCKVDRLSCHLLEYLGRQAFALNVERLDREAQVRRQAAPSIRVSLTMMESPSGMPRGSMMLSPKTSFMSSTFRYGMLAGDFQGALNAACLACQTESMEQAFHEFMVEKGVTYGNYHLTPHERMLRNFATERMVPPWKRRSSMMALVAMPKVGQMPMDIQDVDSDDEAAGPESSVIAAFSARSSAMRSRSTLQRGSSELSSPSARARPESLDVGGEPPQPVIQGIAPLPNAVPEPEAAGARRGSGDTAPKTDAAGAGADRAGADGVGADGADDAGAGIATESGAGAMVVEDAEEEALALPPLVVVPQGVLPSSSGAAIVDAVPRGATAGGPRRRAAAGGDGGVYRWAGIADSEAFPADVAAALAQDFGARLHRYGDREVIHVAAPDLSDLAYQSDEEEALEALSVAYRRVFEAVVGQARRVRLPPLGSAGEDDEGRLPELTIAAVGNALREMGANARKRLFANGGGVELCVGAGADAELYRAALAAADGTLAPLLPKR